MSQGIFINLLQMTVPMVTMNGKRRFPDTIAKLHDIVHFCVSQ